MASTSRPGRLLLATALALATSGAGATALAAPTAQTGNVTPPAAAPVNAQDFSAFVNRVRKTFDVPGIAVGIVKDGKVVMAQGFGLREMNKSARVDGHTLFAIASNTKAFTAAALNMLADEGKLDMNERVIDVLPWFRMSDPNVTYEMRIRDLLAHHSGLSLGAGDLLYWPTTDYTMKQVVQHLARVPLKHGFRSHYAYDNILFGVAAEVIEKVSGQSYGDFLRQHIFKPVGMTGTRVNYLNFKPGDTNIATGQAKYNYTTLKPVAPLSWSNNMGAGGLYSSAADLDKWMITQLNGGKLTPAINGQGGRLFSKKAHQQMWSMITPIPVHAPSVPALKAAEPQFYGYGEGWFLSDYRGHKMVWHTGGWPGFVSRVTMVPGMNLGVVVLTNQQSGAAFQAITMHVLDAYMHAPRTDWIAGYKAAVDKSHQKADAQWDKHKAERDKSAGPSLPLKGYAGTYEDPWYGKVYIKDEGGKLMMRFAHTKQLVGILQPWQHDTFIVHWNDRSLNADAFVNFALDPDGHVRQVRMQAVSSRTDFSFDFQDLRLKPVKQDDHN
ncbi:serine hydrolase [Oleiagrimonas sp. C23AA]|uniref:serine hydrolase n=1 Tax=Oleiagrimonas sp. C23AA TaxID=2719047 RepID=UPI001422D76A|nr:serine hydrolase [Oleiagrimonas sp. C23AA]NII09284.1 serine hydrolase [Oleiagrimonas sp. C23AA]